MFGSYYCYDNPSALKVQLQKWLNNLNGVQYNLLYSVYSFPNFILPFFGGYFVDRFGTNRTLVVFLCFIVIGQAVFALGTQLKIFGVVVLGRVLFGFGGESLCVAQSTLLALWFVGKEVAFAMGLNLSIARLGSVVNDYVSPAIYHAFNVPMALWFGLLVTFMSLTSGIILVFVENAAIRKGNEGRQHADDDEQQRLKQQEDDAQPVQRIQLSDVKNFPVSFWLITFSCVVVYSTVLPFNNILGQFLQNKYHYGLSKADRVLSIPFTIAAAATPFLGGIVDRFGHRTYLLCACGATLATAHGLFAFTHVTPYVPLVIIGISYSVYAAAIWPSVAYVVREHELGTAYGVVTAIQNIGLGVTPLVVGVIKDHFGTYKYVEFMFMCIAIVGFILGIILIIHNARINGVLNLSSKKAQAQRAREIAANNRLIPPVGDNPDYTGAPTDPAEVPFVAADTDRLLPNTAAHSPLNVQEDSSNRFGFEP